MLLFLHRPGLPDVRPRRVEFLIEDADGTSSLVVAVDLTFSGVNDPPIINLNAFQLADANFQTTFIENGAAVPVSNGLWPF